MNTNPLMHKQTPGPSTIQPEAPTMNNMPPRYDKLEFPVDPQPGSPDRQWSFIQTTIKGIAFQGTIQPQHGHGRYRIQGKTLKSVTIEMRAKLEWIYRHGKADIVKLSAQDEKDALLARRRIDDLGFNLTLSVLIGAGVRYYEALASCKLPKTGDGDVNWQKAPDLIGLGLETFSRNELTMGEALNTLVDSFITKPEGDGPLIENNTQAIMIESLLLPLVESFGASTPLRVVARDKDGLENYVKEWLQAENAGAPTTRARRWQETLRFFRLMCRFAEVPEPIESIFGKKPKCPRSSVMAPSPEAINEVLHYQLRECPERLLYTILQVFAGIRPEEAYKLLPIAREQIIADSHIVVPAWISKTKTERSIAARPAFLAWLAKVPHWSDPTYDLMPKDRDGKPIKPGNLQSMLNRQLRKIGRWQGKIPKESLRKSWVSACVALGIPMDPFLIAEAGHTDVFVIGRHYDAKWCRDKGLALFSLFPAEPKSMPSVWDLYHAQGQIEARR